MATHTEHFEIGQVSHSYEGNCKFFEIDHGRTPYFEEESTFEGN